MPAGHIKRGVSIVGSQRGCKLKVGGFKLTKVYIGLASQRAADDGMPVLRELAGIDNSGKDVILQKGLNIRRAIG